jgi:Fur family zinc uptake transcriptional regulator
VAEVRRAAVEQLLDRATAVCQARGVRLTPQRRQVLGIIGGRGQPLGAYEILEALRDQVPGAAPPTVYRALDFLLAHGLVHRIETLHAFVSCPHPDHLHAGQFLICSSCGGVEELEDATLSRSLFAAASATGFNPQRPVVEITGRCARCAGTSP